MIYVDVDEFAAEIGLVRVPRAVTAAAARRRESFARDMRARGQKEVLDLMQWRDGAAYLPHAPSLDALATIDQWAHDGYIDDDDPAKRYARLADAEAWAAEQLTTFDRIGFHTNAGDSGRDAVARSKATAAVDLANLRAARAGRIGRIAVEQWLTLLRASRETCVYCGLRGTSLDYVEPLFLGGSNTIDNVAAACRYCNTSKRAQRLCDWLGSEAPAAEARIAANHEAAFLEMI